MISVPYSDIERQVRDFMDELNISPASGTDLSLDGKRHRYDVSGDKSGSQCGYYLVYTDGLPAGYVGSWKDTELTKWQFDLSGSDISGADRHALIQYSESPEQKANAAQREKELNVERELHTREARVHFDNALAADPSHPYLVRKKIQPHGVRQSGDNLLIPLQNERGELKSLQKISSDPERHKLFWPGASTAGAFFKIDGDKAKPILLCEGFATGATLNELTGYTVICAMSCHNLTPVAQKIRRDYPKHKIFVAADNDYKTDGNPGVRHAREAVKNAKLDGLFFPEFTEMGDGTDWNDYANLGGADEAKRVIAERIAWFSMSDAEKKDATERRELQKLAGTIDTSIKLPDVDYVGGIFPKKFVSVIIAAPGVGKTWFMQRMASDLSVGGSILNGFAQSEPQKTLIIAGEAGLDMLIRRGQKTGWALDKQNLVVYSTKDVNRKGFPIDVDTDDGRKRFRWLIEDNKPDLVFIDTLSAAHNADENKSAEMKPIFFFLLDMAESTDTAIVAIHHTRKKKAIEQNMRITQDDAVGSGVLNRFSSLIVGIESVKADDDDSNENPKNLVKVQKTWFTKFKPFTFRITNDEWGKVGMEIDTNVAPSKSPRMKLLDIIEQTYPLNVWFKASDIGDKLSGNIPATTLRYYLNQLIDQKKLVTKGRNKGVVYARFGTLAMENGHIVDAGTDDDDGSF